MPEENTREVMKRTLKTYLTTAREALNMLERAIDSDNLELAQFWADGPAQASTIELSALIKYIREDGLIRNKNTVLNEQQRKDGV